MADQLLVRIYPFNRGSGHITRRYTYRGTRFDVDRGWYEVPAWVANELKGLYHPSTGTSIFEVQTSEGALQVDVQEAEQEVKSPAARPNKPKAFRGDLSLEEVHAGTTAMDEPEPDAEPIARHVGDEAAVAEKVASKKSSRRKVARRSRSKDNG